MTWFRITLLGTLAAFLLPALAAVAGDTGPYLAGRLLVAAPQLGDPRFQETVIYIVSHDADGAFGLVVNRSLGSGPMDKLLEVYGIDTQGTEESIRIHYGGPVLHGGPVLLGNVYILHSPDYHGPGTTQVPDGLAMTKQRDVPKAILKAIAEGKGPRKSLFVFGYSGWRPGQLEGELARDDWLTAPADDNLIFSDNLEGVWDRAMAKAGIFL